MLSTDGQTKASDAAIPNIVQVPTETSREYRESSGVTAENESIADE